MVEFVNSVLTGLFTGLGVGLANWVHTKHISKRLNLIDKRLKSLGRGKGFGLMGRSKVTGKGE